jgi:hypothetical protein
MSESKNTANESAGDLKGITTYHGSYIWPEPPNAEEAAWTNAMASGSVCSTCGVRGHTKDTHRHHANAAEGLAIRLKPTSDTRMSPLTNI